MLYYVFLRVIVRIPVQIASVSVTDKTDGGPEKMFYNSATETNYQVDTVAFTSPLSFSLSLSLSLALSLSL